MGVGATVKCTLIYHIPHVDIVKPRERERERENFKFERHARFVYHCVSAVAIELQSFRKGHITSPKSNIKLHVVIAI